MPKKEDVELGERLGRMSAQLESLQAAQRQADEDDDDDDEDDDEPEEPFEEKLLKFLKGFAETSIGQHIGAELKSRGGFAAVLDRVLPKK